MSFNKQDILQLSTKKSAFLLLNYFNSIDDEFINQPVPEWKKRLIQERVENDNKKLIRCYFME